MRYKGIILILLAVCAGCHSGAPKDKAAGSNARRPPEVAPIAGANPDIRRALPVRVPAKMVIIRHGDSLTVSFPALEPIYLMVGKNMATGVMREDSVYYDAATHPLGTSLQGGIAFEPSTNVLTLGQEGIPAPGQEFTMQHKITIFETDLPAQHMWSPQSGKRYRVLWTKTFEGTVK